MPLPMTLAVGRQGRPSPAGRGAGRANTRVPRRRGRDGRGRHRQPARVPSRRACARCSPGWVSARSRATSAASCSRPWSWRRSHGPLLPGRRRLARPAGFAELAGASSGARRGLALPPPPAGREPQLPDPGFARFRGDGERHLYTPAIASASRSAGSLAAARVDGPTAATIDAALGALSRRLARRWSAVRPRDELLVRARAGAPPPRRGRGRRSIARRFVVSAMSVGALSPEAHQALTIGIQAPAARANTGEGGEDPAWYCRRRRRRATRGSSRSPRPGSASPPSTWPAPTSWRSRSPRAPSPARAASCPVAR